MESFDPLLIGRYTVIRVRFDYPNDSDLKFFVVLRHVATGARPYCKCIKITSNTQLYENSPDRLAGCVLYKVSEVPFLKKKSVVEPHNDENISHEHFERYTKKGEFEIVGHMPDGFHARLVAAIENSILLNRREKNELLEAIGESSQNKEAGT